MLALFDIDGTLVRTGGAGGRALGRACEALLGWRDALAELDLGGRTDPWIVDALYTRHAGRAATADEFATLIAAYLPLLDDELAARREHVRVLPGVERAIAAVRTRGAHVGLATGNVEAAAQRKLMAAGLWSHFAYGGYGSDARERAALVATGIARGRALAGRDVPADEILVIGDTPLDVHAAHAAGVRAVAVASGGVDLATLRATGAEFVLESLEQLDDVLAHG